MYTVDKQVYQVAERNANPYKVQEPEPLELSFDIYGPYVARMKRLRQKRQALIAERAGNRLLGR